MRRKTKAKGLKLVKIIIFRFRSSKRDLQLLTAYDDTLDAGSKLKNLSREKLQTVFPCATATSAHFATVI